MAKRKSLDNDLELNSDPKLQEAYRLLSNKNVKYKPVPKFKGGCKNC